MRHGFNNCWEARSFLFLKARIRKDLPSRRQFSLMFHQTLSHQLDPTSMHQTARFQGYSSRTFDMHLLQVMRCNLQGQLAQAHSNLVRLRSFVQFQRRSTSVTIPDHSRNAFSFGKVANMRMKTLILW